MRDEYDATAQSAHEGLQALEARQVEVVGRLVQQDQVEPAEQQGGQGRARGLPADSEVIRAWPPASRPSSASIDGIRSSRSGAPLAIQWSNATA